MRPAGHVAAVLPWSYVRGVHAAGGRAVLITPDAPDVDALDGLDAIVFTGGPDVDPSRYGEPPHPTTTVRPERDAAELLLMAAAIDADLPVLAVCRGMQLLVVRYGGALHQHLPEVLGTDRHRPVTGPKFGEHPVRLAGAAPWGACSAVRPPSIRSTTRGYATPAGSPPPAGRTRTAWSRWSRTRPVRSSSACSGTRRRWRTGGCSRRWSQRRGNTVTRPRRPEHHRLMGKVYEAIDGRLRDFLLAQRMFFVATAPSGADGHVNLSPKGLTGSFAVLDDHRAAYLDYTGSGAETIAHLRDNGRIVLMFCAFDGPPRIVRLHGRGEPVFPGDPRFDGLLGAFPAQPAPGLRSIILVDVARISDSCGYAVPLMEYAGDRDLLGQWSARKSEAGLDRYRADKNARSLDGLPAVPVTTPTAG